MRWHALLGMAIPALVSAQTPADTSHRQPLGDAWWTGPMLAASAGTLPQGHVLIEPYLYDVTAPHTNGFASRTYLVYGLLDRLSVGLIPIFGFNQVSNGPSSSGVGIGDLTAQAQYRLTQFHPGGWVPTTSLIVQEAFPTGKFDELGARPSNGFGAGAYTTTVALYSQTYFWMPNGRILRTRLNLSQSFSSEVGVKGVSVYGTGPTFVGHAWPGNTSYVDAAAEYSMTRSWVLALDVTYSHAGSTRLTGGFESGTSDGFGFAPAVEYNWTSSVGLLLGTRILPAGHNTTASITPAIAVNIVR